MYSIYGFSAKSSVNALSLLLSVLNVIFVVVEWYLLIFLSGTLDGQTFGPLACAHVAYATSSVVFFLFHGAGEELENSRLLTNVLGVDDEDLPEEDASRGGGGILVYLCAVSSVDFIAAITAYVVADCAIRPASYAGASSPFLFIGVVAGNVLLARIILSYAFGLVCAAAAVAGEAEEDAREEMV